MELKLNNMDGYVNRYEVTIYHGGEAPTKIIKAKSLGSARQLAMQGEHSEIIDLKTNTIVE